MVSAPTQPGHSCLIAVLTFRHRLDRNGHHLHVVAALLLLGGDLGPASGPGILERTELDLPQNLTKSDLENLPGAVVEDQRAS